MEKEVTNPLHRIDSLKTLSREHHDGLLLCWKIRQGINKKISAERISRYSKHFFSNRLWPHFEVEEKELFPLLGKSKLVAQAKEEHRRLGYLFLIGNPGTSTLDLIQQLLQKHIRFEERVLFKELQEKVPVQELEKAMAEHRGDNVEESWEDKFWQ
jgi:hemerythrin-like domain-containing protein